MIATTFSPAQQHLLQVMSFVKTDEALEEMKEALANFFAQRAEEEMDKLWDSGVVNDDVINQWLSEHMRTPYK